jgi:hypothetical protein
MLRVEAEALGGLNAGGGAGDAEAELVVGREGEFVDAGGGVEDAGGVGGVDLERGVVGGDERPAPRGGSGWRWRRRARAFFGIGGGAELVEEDERVWAGEAREAVEVDDVRGEGGERGSMDWASPMSARNAVKTGKLARRRGRAGRPGPSWRAGRGLEGDGFAAGVGAADDELALRRMSSSVRGTMRPPGAEALFEQRMAGGFEAQRVGRRLGRDAVVVAGEAGAGLQAVDQSEDAGAGDEAQRRRCRPGG